MATEKTLIHEVIYSIKTSIENDLESIQIYAWGKSQSL